MSLIVCFQKFALNSLAWGLGLCVSLLGSERLLAADWTLDEMVTNRNGQRVFSARPVDVELQNPWPPALEAEFQRRADRIISLQTERVKGGVNPYFENEKRTYGYLMAQDPMRRPHDAYRGPKEGWVFTGMRIPCGSACGEMASAAT